MSPAANGNGERVELQSDSISDEPPARRKQRRPDGRDVTRYKGCEKWTYRHWAWAFLYRNEKFRAACREADASGDDKKKAEVAAEYGLKRYKSYKEGYNNGIGRPTFSVGSISSWSHLDFEGDGVWKPRVSLHGGQVLIRFDVAAALNDIRILEKQVRVAHNRLKKRLKSIGIQLNKEARIRRDKTNTFGHYLRLLDLKADGATLVEAGTAISRRNAKNLNDERHNLTEEDLASRTSKQMKRAIEYATELYRYLAVLKGRPRANIPLD